MRVLSSLPAKTIETHIPIVTWHDYRFSSKRQAEQIKIKKTRLFNFEVGFFVGISGFERSPARGKTEGKKNNNKKTSDNDQAKSDSRKSALFPPLSLWLKVRGENAIDISVFIILFCFELSGVP